MLSFKQFIKEQEYLEERLIVFNGGKQTGQVVFLAGGAGCHPKNTPILMYDGSTKMSQDICVGDVLMGPDSKPKRVMETHSGREEMLKLTTNKGESIVTNRSHIHSFVCSFSKCGLKRGHIYNMAIDEYYSLPLSAQKSLKLYRSSLLHFSKPTNDFIVDPYILGYWLGDGIRNIPAIIVGDSDSRVVEHFREVIGDEYEIVIPKQNKIGCKQYNLTYIGKLLPKRRNPYRSYLREHCFDGVSKRIPKEYLTSSEKNRKALFAGIVDSDGHNGGGYYEIITVFDGLKDDIMFLARSLGYHVSYSEKFARWNGEIKKYHRLNILGNNFEDLPIQHDRKKVLNRKMNKNVLRYGFSAEFLSEDDYFGFSVDGDQLYVTGDFFVTHNSGKGYAKDNFLDSRNFKSFDVDEWKKLILAVDKVKKRYPEVRNLNLKNAKDVTALHEFADKMGLKDKFYNNFFSGIKPGNLPNILFDITAKNVKSIEKLLPTLYDLGYEKRGIHLIWVLANFDVAVEANAARSRVVATDILLDTHIGAAKTMYELLFRGGKLDIDGQITVILNNRDQTMYHHGKDSNGDPIKLQMKLKKGKTAPVSDFSYIKVKKEGGKMDSRNDVKEKLLDWVKSNIPRTPETEYIFTS